MSISRRSGTKRFAGIVAVGKSKSAACGAYRAAVTNLDLTLCSESNVFTAIAGEMESEVYFSPMSGQEITVDTEAAKTLQSNSSVSDDTVNVHVSVCADGCSKVLVSDYETEFCPSCSSAIPELSNEQVLEELARLESESSDDNFDGDNVMDVTGDQGIVVVASSLEEAQQLFSETVSGNSVTMTDGSASYATHTSCSSEYSPFTGEYAEVSEDDEEVDLSSISSAGDSVQAHYFACVSEDCKSHIISTSEDSNFCPSCSSGLIDPEILEAIASAGGDDIDDLDELDLEDEDDIDFESESSDDELDELDLDDLEDDLDDLDEDIDLESESSDMDDDDLDLDDLDDLDEDLDDLDDEFESDSSDDEDDLEDDLDELDDEEDDEDDLDLDDLEDDEDDYEEDEDFESESSVAEVEVDLFEAYAGVDVDQHKPEQLQVSHCGQINGESTWFAFYNGMPVARCLESNSGNPLFNSAKFGEAVAATVRTQGVRAGLTDMGFDFLKPDVDFGVAVSSKLIERHQTELQEMHNSVAERVSEVQDRFQAALSTSAMALNRGVVKGKRNPIADTLVSAIQAAGIGSAEKLVASAFEQHSDNFVKELVELAAVQVNKPLESQNDFAEMVAQATFAGLSSSNSQGVEIGRSLSATASAHKQQAEESAPLQSQSSAPDDFGSRLSSVFSNL